MPDEQLPLHDLGPRVEGHAAAVVRRERGDVRGAGEHALHEVGVDVRPRPPVREGDGGRCEAVPAGVAAPPQPHLRARARPARRGAACPSDRSTGRDGRGRTPAPPAARRRRRWASRAGRARARRAAAGGDRARRRSATRWSTPRRRWVPIAPVVDDAHQPVVPRRRGGRPSSHGPAGRRRPPPARGPRSRRTATAAATPPGAAGRTAPADPIGSTPCAWVHGEHRNSGSWEWGSRSAASTCAHARPRVRARWRARAERGR